MIVDGKLRVELLYRTLTPSVTTGVIRHCQAMLLIDHTFLNLHVILLLCRLLVVGSVLKWLPGLFVSLLLCRLLVVGSVLKWLPLLLLFLHLRKLCPGHTVVPNFLKHGRYIA